MKFRKAISFGLILAMSLSLCACGKGFKAKTPDEVIDIFDDLDYDNACKFDKLSDLDDSKSFYLQTSERGGRLGDMIDKAFTKQFEGDLEDVIISVAQPNEDNAVVVFYVQYENSDDARDYFEDEIYEEFVEIVEKEKEIYFDGDIEYDLSKKSGYVMLRGTLEVEDWLSDNVDFDFSHPEKYLDDIDVNDLIGDSIPSDMDIGSLSGLDPSLIGSLGGFDMDDIDMPDVKIKDEDIIVGYYYSDNTITIILAPNNKASAGRFEEIVEMFGYPMISDEK